MIRISGLEEESVVDGPGLRFVIFTQGCPHQCKGCHNPSTWSFDSGYDISIEEIINKIDSNPFVDGITISGGEPVMQLEKMLPLLKHLKEKKLEIALYSGYTFEQIIKIARLKECLTYLDILIDGRFVEELKDLSLRFKGSTNQRIVDVQESLKNNKVILNQNMDWN